jgi:O-antigen/teichoic acid export membrane protein
MNRIAKNFIVNGLSSLLSQLITFITVAYYAKCIGKEFFGSITLAQQIILYFSIAVLFGLQTLGVRMISDGSKSAKEAMTEIISFRLLIALVCFIVIIIMSVFMTSSYNFNFILLLFAITLFPIAMNLDWLFIGLQRMQHNAVYNLCKSIVPAMLIFIFVKDGSKAYVIPLTMLLGLFIGTIYQYTVLTYKYKVAFKFKFDYNKFKSLGRLAFPFLTSGLLAMVNNNIDKIIIGFTRSKGELGIYQAAYTFISFFITLESLVFTPIFPAMINLFNDSNFERLKALTKALAKYILLLILPITLGGLVLSKDIIRFVYGEEYIAAFLPFSILLIYILILYCREIFAYGLNAWNGEVKYLKAVSVSAGLNAVLCLIFVPRFGYIAAAIITTVTEVVNLIMMRLYANNIVEIKIIDNFIILVPAVLMFCFTYILQRMGIDFILNIIISMTIYLILLYAMKIVNIKELKSLLSRK